MSRGTVTVTVPHDSQVVQMVCNGCTSRLPLILRPEDPMRALRFCPVCGSRAVFFNAEDQQL